MKRTKTNTKKCPFFCDFGNECVKEGVEFIHDNNRVSGFHGHKVECKGNLFDCEVA